MAKKDIDFRELLERVLPLDELPPHDRLSAQNALRTGIAEQIEQAALIALAQLERHGAVQRMPSPSSENHGSTLRFQRRGRLEVITVEMPEPLSEQGVLGYARSRLPTQGQTELHQVRRLMRIEGPTLTGDPRTDDPRAALLEQLDPIGRDLFAARSTRIHVHGVNGAGVDPTVAPAYHPLVERARREPGRLFYCPDALTAPGMREFAARRGIRSVVCVAVTTSGGEPLGVLEVLSSEPNAYDTETLALMALVSDCCAGALERAARIEKLVFVDPLTGAYNRSYFDHQVVNEMARAQRENESLALCIVDIDDFKSFNSIYGYEAGNQVLVQVTQALRSGVRSFDTLSRWGGEEFAVLLSPPVQLVDAETISERLRSLVERQVVYLQALDGETHPVNVTVSIGVAIYPEHQTTAAELWRAANQALLVAKRQPKNQVVFFSR